MLPDEVRKAVQRIQNNVSSVRTVAYGDWDLVRAHLLAREAEVDALRAQAMQSLYRAKFADDLLREVVVLLHPDTDEHKRITAHLSENSRAT